MRFFNDIINLLFPRVCGVCDQGLAQNEDVLCFHCRSELPKIEFSDVQENELVNRFYGKLDVDFGISYLYFYKSGITQKLLHQFKYKNQPEIGELIGSWVGYKLMESKIEDGIDLLIPVPLHKKKERIRGYNQSYFFAKGISEVTRIPIDNTSLKRINYEDSQTHKTKAERWKSVENAFSIDDNRFIDSKRILLIDDVITTGATLEACGHQLLNHGAASISIATMAMAK